MDYPKPMMKISELTKMGYSKEWLLEIARSRVINRDYKIVTQKNPAKKNSPFYFDTEALEKYRRARSTGR